MMKRVISVLMAVVLILIMAAGCETDKPVQKQEQKEPIRELAFGFKGSIKSYDDYLQYLEDYSDKAFVTFEKNDVFGEFDSFAVYGYNNTEIYYAYWFRDGARAGIIQVNFRNKTIEDIEPDFYDSFEKLSEADIQDPTDLRYVGDPGIYKAVLRLNGIDYVYHSGKLIGPSFFVNGLEFMMSVYSGDGDANGDTGSYMYWSDLEKDELNPFIQRLLNAETAPAAVAELAARVPK